MLQVAIISALLALLTLGGLLLKMKASRITRNTLFLLAFISYTIGALYFTVLSRVPRAEPKAVFWPFASYLRIFQESEHQAVKMLTGPVAEFFMSSNSPIEGNVLNLLLFIPLGYLLPELIPGTANKHVLFIALLVTLCIEVVQFVWKLGWFEVDDILHNMLGATLGLRILRKQNVYLIRLQASKQD